MEAWKNTRVRKVSLIFVVFQRRRFIGECFIGLVLEFKEKREKKSFLKDSMQKGNIDASKNGNDVWLLVKKALGKGKTSKTKTEDPQQPPKEQKQQLLSHKYASDEDPITHSFLGRIPGIQRKSIIFMMNCMIKFEI